MASKHTPGPWVPDPDNSRIVASDGHGIFAFRRLFAEIAGNCYLAAAAPDLLAALQWIKDHPKANADQVEAVIDKAIAKAEGR